MSFWSFCYWQHINIESRKFIAYTEQRVVLNHVWSHVGTVTVEYLLIPNINMVIGTRVSLAIYVLCKLEIRLISLKLIIIKYYSDSYDMAAS